MSETRKTAIEARFDAQRIAFGPIVFQIARVLRDTGILEGLHASSEGLSLDELLADTEVSRYGLSCLLTCGESFGILSTTDHVRYRLTKTGYFLFADDMTRVNMDFVHDVCYQGAFHLDASIASGTPAGLKVFGEWATVYEALASLPERVQKSWFAFDHFYSDSAFPAALEIVFSKAPKSLLDIGGNTGRWARACAEFNADVGLGIVDLPGQLAKAQANFKELGLAHRLSAHPTNLLDPTAAFPAGYDVLWMSQFLVCFSEAEVEGILRRAADAMAESSSLFILDTYWDLQSYEISKFCLNASTPYFTCIANGNSKMYASSEIKDLIAAAGLAVVEAWDGLGISHTLWRCQLAR